MENHVLSTWNVWFHGNNTQILKSIMRQFSVWKHTAFYIKREYGKCLVPFWFVILAQNMPFYSNEHWFITIKQSCENVSSFCLNADCFLSEIYMVFSRFPVRPNSPGMFCVNVMNAISRRKIKIKITLVFPKWKELQFMEDVREARFIFN